MTIKHLFIGIDSGTQGTKTIVFDVNSNTIVAEAQASHTLIENPDGKREQHPRMWIDALEQTFISIFKDGTVKASDVRAIGVSGQQHGMVPLDAEGNVIRDAKLWCDTATTRECEQITEELGGSRQVIDLIGNSIAVGFTASKLLWMKKYEPENYNRLDCMLLPHDYLNFWLTGEKKTECGDASGTAYFDIRNRTWSYAVLNAIDPSGRLQNCLPELIESQDPVGTIRTELAEKYGFARDILVSSGGGDNMMAAIGTGNVSDGLVTASLGTSGTIYTCSSQPVVDQQGELAAFCSSTGAWLPLVCTMNVTVATELTRRVLKLPVEELNNKAAQAAVGSGGILLIPFFNGERTPALPDATASFFGLNSSNYTTENLCRAAMEGATFGLRYGLDVLKRNGINAGEIRLVGGGSKSALWRQIVADVFNCEVVSPACDEAGALGAALQAAWCFHNRQKHHIPLQEITDRCVSLDQEKSASPDPQRAKQYSALYEQYLKVEQTLRRLYD